ncbi:MAG: kynureninase [Phycisphaerales bacterium]|nr:kynureninase [Phycisphaerales bacterium]
MIPTSAAELDAADPLRECRDLFHIPPGPDGKPCVYLCGNSLGLQPKSAAGLVQQEMEDWARLGVAAHLEGREPWLPYHEQFREPAARLVGGVPGEAVMMNSLTVNLHLLMATFYRPTRERFKIVIEDSSFPSDSYAVASQAAWHGLDPASAVVRLRPREGEHALRTDDVEAALEREGKAVALVLLGAVNYLTGQWMDMARITLAAKRQGAVVGWDLAHAAGNVPLRLHDWNADFAAWCSYKYLNSGPGAVAGAWVHERHARDTSLPRLAGWWGNDPATRFRMGPEFVARPGADGWQLSNPPIFSLAPVRASLDIFNRVGMDALRGKSIHLTAHLESLLRQRPPGRVNIITPSDPHHRGCQLSLVLPGVPRDIEHRLRERGVIVDFREPDVIRAAPVPLYNSFGDVERFVAVLGGVLGA